MENKNWKQEMYKFLRNYRATPNYTFTKVPPATALFGRPMKTRLPQVPVKPEQDELLRGNYELSKTKMKFYADMKPNVKHSKLEEGDAVLLKNDYMSKRFPPYDPRPYEVVERKGTMVRARRDSK